MIDQFYSDPLSVERLRSGPLGSHIDTFAQMLSAQDYARSTAKEKIRVIAGLSGWLQRRQLGVETLDEQSISAFLRHWRRQGLCRRTTSHTLKMMLGLLRDRGFTRKVASVENSVFIVPNLSPSFGDS